MSNIKTARTCKTDFGPKSFLLIISLLTVKCSTINVFVHKPACQGCLSTYMWAQLF